MKAVQFAVIALLGALADSRTQVTDLDIQTFYYKTGTSKNEATNNISSDNLGFNACTCDLTDGGCDQACCCDPDCDAKTITAWRLQPGYCIDEREDHSIISLE